MCFLDLAYQLLLEKQKTYLEELVMTTMFNEEVICGNCGKDIEIMVIGSTNTFGVPDLDTRPAEMARSTLSYDIQHCPNCDYCNADISEDPADKKDYMEMDIYKSIILSRALSDTASHFIASSFLNESIGQYANATWDMIYAAWTCDDNNETQGAIECRKNAVKLIREVNKASQDISYQDGATEAIQADLLRRAGLFEEALEIVKLVKTEEYIINRVLSFEKKLIQKSDKDIHTIEEALDEKSHSVFV